MEKKSIFFTNKIFIYFFLKNRLRSFFLCFLIFPFTLFAQQGNQDSSSDLQEGIVLTGGAQIVENISDSENFSETIKKTKSYAKLIVKNRKERKAIPEKSKSGDEITKKIPATKVKHHYYETTGTHNFVFNRQQDSVGICIENQQVATWVKTAFLEELSSDVFPKLFTGIPAAIQSISTLSFSVRPPPAFLL